MTAWRMPELPIGVVRPVVTVPADVLTSPCAPIDPRDPAVAQLAADLLATMAVSPGCVGLAANQIGQSARVFSLDVTAHPKTRTHHGVFVLCNPVLEQATRRQRGREGCMSVPDWTGDVRRATRVRVSGELPVTGEPVTIEADGRVLFGPQQDHTGAVLRSDSSCDRCHRVLSENESDPAILKTFGLHR